MTLTIHDSQKCGTGYSFFGDNRQEIINQVQMWLDFFSDIKPVNAEAFLDDCEHTWYNV